jgi:hypothetical protein
MHFQPGKKPRDDAVDTIPPPCDPAKALLERFTCWEKRLDNLIDFFTAVQSSQKDHSRQYAGLSRLAAEKFEDEDNFDADGVLCIWKVLKEKTAQVSRFYDGLPESYNEVIIKDLRLRLADVRVFKSEIQRLRKWESAKVAKRHKKFIGAVNALNSSINRVGRLAPGDDPFVENRRTFS